MILTANEVAERLRIHPDTVYSQVRQNKIPHFWIGKRVLFDEDSLKEWIESQIKASFKGVHKDM